MPAMLCPSCGKMISSDVSECPFCGQRRPGMFGFANSLRKIGLQVEIPRLIVYLCGGLYILALAIDPQAIFQPRGMMSLLAPSSKASIIFGMTGAIPVLVEGRWWTVITAIYLHGGLLHIFFNMMWVRQLAPVVEDMFGPFRLFVIFTVAGIAGFVLSSLMAAFGMALQLFGFTLLGGAGYTLGASGSIFGLLAAAIAYGRRLGSPLFTRQFMQWAGFLFIFGLIFPGIDNWAHAGGFLGGYGMALLFMRDGSGEGSGALVGAAACLLATVVAFGLQLVTMIGLLF
jgi:rhomboid protease GluP